MTEPEDDSETVLFQSVVERVRGVAIFTLDPVGIIQSWNIGAATLTGYRRSEILGEHISTLYSEETKGHSGPAPPWKRGQRERRFAEAGWIARKDGTRVWVDVTCSELRHQDGRVTGYAVIARDRSDRNEAAEAQRRLAEERQELIIEASQRLSASLDYSVTLRNVVDSMVPRFADWCVIAALDGEEIHWVAARHADPAKDHRLGEILDRRQPHEPDAPVGLHRALVSGEPELVRNVSEQWLRGAVRTDATLHIVQELGARSAIFVPLVARGRTLGAIGFVSSDSGRCYGDTDFEFAKEIAGRAALFVDNARLFQAEQQAVRMRDEVLSIVAHDLRNPLGRILMGADLLLDISDGDETQRRQLQILRRAADGMNRLIQDLLEVSRIESGGGLAIQPEQQSVAPLITHACEMLRPAAEEKGLALDCDRSADDLTVKADRDRFLQVMSNLIGNAIKFTERGGVTVRANRDDGGVRFSVVDTGPGIPAEALDHLFERFWQARQSRRGGAGLGLAITRGIIEAHGGQIWVESEVGRGTTFHFTLPDS